MREDYILFRAAFNFRANENHALKNINMERQVENHGEEEKSKRIKRKMRDLERKLRKIR